MLFENTNPETNPLLLNYSLKFKTMYLIKYHIQVKKTIRDEWFFFTDYITKTILREDSTILDTEEEVKSFSERLKDGSIISITKI